MDFFGFDVLSNMPCCQTIFVLFFSNGLKLGDTAEQGGGRSIWDEYARGVFKSEDLDEDENEKDSSTMQRTYNLFP